jgi:hypothetical protein
MRGLFAMILIVPCLVSAPLPEQGDKQRRLPPTRKPHPGRQTAQKMNPEPAAPDRLDMRVMPKKIFMPHLFNNWILQTYHRIQDVIDICAF